MGVPVLNSFFFQPHSPNKKADGSLIRVGTKKRAAVYLQRHWTRSNLF